MSPLQELGPKSMHIGTPLDFVEYPPESAGHHPRLAIEAAPVGLGASVPIERSDYEFFPFMNGQSKIECSRDDFRIDRDEANYLAFLSRYRTSGVPFRELIMFANLRASGKLSENHWLPSGEIRPTFRPTGDKSVYELFVSECFRAPDFQLLGCIWPPKTTSVNGSHCR